MSEEFLRVARKEVSEDISKLGILLQKCKTDADVFSRASDMEKHIHKIKGLAPMMGQEQIGYIATLLDAIFKVLLSGKSLDGIFHIMTDSHVFMNNAINGAAKNYDSLVLQIKSDYKDLF